jgi:hypothetical protein
MSLQESLWLAVYCITALLLVVLAVSLAGYVWLWWRYLGARHFRSFRRHMIAAENEFGVSRHLIAAVIAGEALDALRFWKHWLEPVGELIAARSRTWKESSSYGVGQLRLYEVRRFRKNNPLIEGNPYLKQMMDGRLAWNREGNIYLVACKLNGIINEIGHMNSEDRSKIASLAKIDVAAIAEKTALHQDYTYPEVCALYAAYNEEPANGMESGSYWDWLKAKSAESRIAERVALQYMELKDANW